MLASLSTCFHLPPPTPLVLPALSGSNFPAFIPVPMFHLELFPSLLHTFHTYNSLGMAISPRYESYNSGRQITYPKVCLEMQLIWRRSLVHASSRVIGCLFHTRVLIYRLWLNWFYRLTWESSHSLYIISYRKYLYKPDHFIFNLHQVTGHSCHFTN